MLQSSLARHMKKGIPFRYKEGRAGRLLKKSGRKYFIPWRKKYENPARRGQFIKKRMILIRGFRVRKRQRFMVSVRVGQLGWPVGPIKKGMSGREKQAAIGSLHMKSGPKSLKTTSFDRGKKQKFNKKGLEIESICCFNKSKGN